MKKLILSALLLSIVSCSTPESEPIQQLQQNDCGTIIGMGTSPDSNYIDVKMDYQSPGSKNRYQVSDIYQYNLNQKICNFDGLKQIAW